MISDTLQNEMIERHLIAASVMPTGNPWLDDALAGGINKENLILAAAKTGVGKTFFGVQLAQFAARLAKRVIYFALEAEKYEIERRQLYYYLIKLLFEHFPKLPRPRYREWLHAGYQTEWATLEKTAKEKLAIDSATLVTKYKTGVYTPDQFGRDVRELISDPEKPDLIILDHLHHFFLEGDEITALKTTIHQIKRLKEELDAPIVVLAQLRKGDGATFGKRTLPKTEDIRGTAALSDIATDVLIISPVPEEKTKELPQSKIMPMYFYLSKSRTAPEAREFAGISCFDAAQGKYQDNYYLAKVRFNEDPELLSAGPHWAKRAVYPKPKPVANNWARNRIGENDE